MHSNANTARNSNSAEASAAAKTKQVLAAYTRIGSATRVALYLTRSNKERASVMGGYIGEQHVSVFVRQRRSNGKAFLSIVTDNNDQLGTANIRVIERSGIPTMKAELDLNGGGVKQELWISLRKEVGPSLLERMGCNMAKLRARAQQSQRQGAAI